MTHPSEWWSPPCKDVRDLVSEHVSQELATLTGAANVVFTIQSSRVVSHVAFGRDTHARVVAHQVHRPKGTSVLRASAADQITNS